MVQSLIINTFSNSNMMKLSSVIIVVMVLCSIAICVMGESWPYSFDPKKPPKWSQQDIEVMRKIFPGGVRVEPTPTGRKYVFLNIIIYYGFTHRAFNSL
jgi:hypothetical protein